MSTDAPHLLTGKQGEDAAEIWLQQNGFTLLIRNWRYRYCEIDAIAHKNKILHFFEVKTRTSDYLLPEQSVGTQKLRKMKQGAEQYLYLNPQWKMIQFNVLSIIIRSGGQMEFFLLEDVF